MKSFFREFSEEIFQRIPWAHLLQQAGKILLIFLLLRLSELVIRRIFKHSEIHLTRRKEEEAKKRLQTLLGVSLQGIILLFWGIASLLVLTVLGIDIAPILTGAGILGVALGFGTQHLIRDLISGFFLIVENQIRVGDVATILKTTGFVEAVNFRTTILRELNGTVHVFPNGVIQNLSNLTNGWSAYVFEIPVSYSEKTDNVITMISEVWRSLHQDPVWKKLILDDDVEIFGVDRFEDSSVIIKGRIRTLPIRQWEVKREFLRRIKIHFDEAGIRIPFPQMTIHRAGRNDDPSFSAASR